MSLGLTSRKEKLKLRNARIMFSFKFIFFIATIFATFYYAFKMGGKISQDEISRWKDQYDLEKKDNDDLRVALGSNKAEAEQLSRLIPNQEIRDLLIIANNRNADGITIPRMTNMISGMTKTEKCTSEAVMKRMSVATPIVPTAQKVSFGRGLVNIGAKGSPALSSDGKPEAWFAKNKEINVNFTLPGGENQEISGMLPLYHSIILQKIQYKFSIVTGRRGFADISMIKCDL